MMATVISSGIQFYMVAMVEAKEVDGYGRIVLPKSWRGRKVWLLDRGNEIKVIPRRTSKLTDFFDEAEIDVGEFMDYHKLKAEMQARKLGSGQ